MLNASELGLMSDLGIVSVPSVAESFRSSGIGALKKKKISFLLDSSSTVAASNDSPEVGDTGRVFWLGLGRRWLVRNRIRSRDSWFAEGGAENENCGQVRGRSPWSYGGHDEDRLKPFPDWEGLCRESSLADGTPVWITRRRYRGEVLGGGK